MATPKVPALLHKMSVSSQKAWYKKQGMELPDHLKATSAAKAKKDVGEINIAKAKAARLATIAAAAKKTIQPSSERVRAMRKNADQFGGGLGGGLQTNRDIISFARSGGYIKAGRLGEEKDESEYGYEGDMAKSQLKSIMVNSQKLHDMLEPDTDLPEWVQSKITLAQDYVQTAADYMETQNSEDLDEANNIVEQNVQPSDKEIRMARGIANDKRYKEGNITGAINAIEKIRIGLSDHPEIKSALKSANEEVEQMYKDVQYIEEKLSASDPASKWIADFVKSDNPKFAGKSKKERIQQALGAYYAAKRGTNEEVEQIDEVNSRYDMTQALTPKSSNIKAAVGTTARDKAATNKYARRISKLTGGEYSKQDVKAHLKSLANEEVEQIDELKASTVAYYAGVNLAKQKSTKDPQKMKNRTAGFKTAMSKLTGKAKVPATFKEEVEQVEEAHKVGDKVMVKKELSDEKEDMVGTVHAVRGAEVTVKLPKDRGNITVLHREVKKVNEEGDMSPAVKAAQAKFDAQTKAQTPKKRQAGTSFGTKLAFFKMNKSNPVKESMDEVGKEDDDVNNDGKADKTDVYLAKRRKSIGSAIKKAAAEKMGK